MEISQFDNGNPSPFDHNIENIHASIVGLSVDYLVRLANGAAPRDAFEFSLMGAGNISLMGTGDFAHEALANTALLL